MAKDTVKIDIKGTGFEKAINELREFIIKSMSDEQFAEQFKRCMKKGLLR